MTIVNSKEFVSNEDKYFDLAMEEQVLVKKGDNMFFLVYKNIDEMNTYHDASVYDEVLEPDDDFYSAVPMDEIRKKVHVLIDKLYANESNSITESI